MRQPVVLCLVGPTATGKTEAAVKLAERFPFEIVSVDSAMIYRHMDIGTAKPSRAVLEVAPHRLIDIRDPWQSYSAGEFCDDAWSAIADIRRSGRVPLLVGGTLMYFRALRKGLAALPTADPEIRRALEARAALEGWAALHAELARIDPAAAGRIARSDRQRIQRALEVYALTGEPISQLQEVGARRPHAEFIRIALTVGDRAALHERIDARFAQMMRAGFLGEVERLHAMEQMSPDATAMRAVGYRQLWAYLDGAVDLATATRDALTATRRLAKRQLTWMRADVDELCMDCMDSELETQLANAIEARAGVIFGERRL